MKLNKYILFLLLNLLTVLIGCKSPLQDVKLIVNSKLFKTKIAFQIVDAVPNSTTPINSIIAKVYGGVDYSNPDNSILSPSYVLDSKGQRNYKVVNGFTSMYLAPGIDPTNTKPVRFTIVFSAPGYQKTYFNVSLNKIGNYNFRVQMIKTDNKPQGLTTISNSFFVGTSGTGSNDNFTLTANGSGTQAFGATLFIPSGTRFYGSNGNELTGNLTATITHYNNQTDNSLQSFPGGLDVNAGIYQGSPTGNFTFITAGLVDVQINAGNEPVTSFSNPVNLIIGVDPNTYNPNTQSMVGIGQNIPVWAMNPENGVWTYLQEANIVSGPNGGLQSTSSISNPGIINFDWRVNNNGFSSSQIGIDGESQGQFPPSGLINLKLYFYNTNTYYGREQWLSIDEIRNGAFYSFPNLPEDIQFVLRAFYGSQLVAESNPFSSSISTIFLNFNFSGFNFINYFNVNANIYGTCPNQPDVRNAPDCVVYVKNDFGYYDPVGWMDNGYYSGYFQSGKTYNYGIFLYGTLFEESFTIESGFSGNLEIERNVTLSPDACDGL